MCLRVCLHDNILLVRQKNSTVCKAVTVLIRTNSLAKCKWSLVYRKMLRKQQEKDANVASTPVEEEEEDRGN